MEKKKLTPAFDLIGQTFKLYFQSKNITYVIKVIGTQMLIGILLLIPALIFYTVTGVAAGFSGPNINQSFGIGAGIFSIVGILVFGIIVYWFGAADIIMAGNISEGKIAGVKETFKLGWNRLLRYFVVTVAAGLLIALGYILFIIPGIIFSIWYSFSHIISVLENQGVGNSMSKSKKFVKGLFWPVLGRFLLIGVVGFVINLVLQFIPIIGIVLIAFVSPLFILYLVLLYKDLLRVKEG